MKSKPNVLKASDAPEPNEKSIRQHKSYGKLFSSAIPDAVDGFECTDAEKMSNLYPAGTAAAREVSKGPVLTLLENTRLIILHLQIFERFLNTQARASQLGDASPLSEDTASKNNDNRMDNYKDDRNRCDIDSSSRMR